MKNQNPKEKRGIVCWQASPGVLVRRPAAGARRAAPPEALARACKRQGGRDPYHRYARRRSNAADRTCPPPPKPMP